MLEAFRTYIPVEAFTRQRVERPKVAVPDVGLRWGQSSRFRWSHNQNSQTPKSGRGYNIRDNSEIEVPDYYIIGVVTPDIQHRLVWDRRADGTSIRIQRVQYMSFSYTNTKREVGLTKEIQYKVHLTFDLHPPRES